MCPPVAARPRAEVALRQREGGVGLDVTDQDQRAIVGRVIGAIELRQIGHGPGLDVHRPADGGDPVRMDLEGGGLHLLVEQCRIAVLDAQPPLRVDHLALVLDHGRLEGQIGDAVALELEHQLQCRTREPVLVHRDVLGGVGIVAAALGFHEPVELALCAAARAVEHHVLEKMRQTGPARTLIAAAHAHPVVQRDARDVVVGPDHELQSVGEPHAAHVLDGIGKRARPRGDRGRAFRPFQTAQIFAGHRVDC
jgi:hypothetical protein